MDDEDLVRNVAGKMLEFLGYEVVLARDGVEAIALYQSGRASNSPYDAVILDLQVPGGMDGARTLAELLRMDPNVKGIISSGYGDQPPEGAVPEGQVATIAKPYELKKLGALLDEVLAGQGRGVEG